MAAPTNGKDDLIVRLLESWSTIGDSLADDAGPGARLRPRAQNAIDSRPGRWHVLFGDGPRSLVVPSLDRRAQRTSIKFFLTRPLHRLYAELLLQANRWPLRLLSELTLPPLEGPNLLDELALPPCTQVAFQIGTPGPYQKASMLIMADDGNPLALMKISLKESADDMVKREAHWLRELARHTPLHGKVPQLLTYGSVRYGRSYLGISVAPSNVATNAFTPAHATFLAELARTKTVTTTFTNSSAYCYLADTLAQLHSVIPAPMATALTDSLDQCAYRLSRAQSPYVLAHGDFARWNIRLHGGEIFVFDWEYAAEGALALHDFFHFFLAPPALSGHIGHKQLMSLLDRARTFAREIHPGFAWEQPIVAAQCLGYLLHTVLYYTASRGSVLKDHPVIKAYYKLIEERRRWVD